MEKKHLIVPITREFLINFYSQYTLSPVPETYKEYYAALDSIIAQVKCPSSIVEETAGLAPGPTRIDDCFYRNRMLCEELSLSFKNVTSFISERKALLACERCQEELVASEAAILFVQKKNVQSVKLQLKQFMPQDFRGAIMEKVNEAKEARYTKQVEQLISQGGSIRQKYDLLLQQQWERRQGLAQLGECSGAFRFLIRYLAGIPPELLDFTKEINAKLGPMEEQRLKYGPDLYIATGLGIKLNVALAACLEALRDGCAASDGAKRRELLVLGSLDLLETVVHFYGTEVVRVVQFIGNIFQHSPFFLTKNSDGKMCPVDAASSCASSLCKTSSGPLQSLTEKALEQSSVSSEPPTSGDSLVGSSACLSSNSSSMAYVTQGDPLSAAKSGKALASDRCSQRHSHASDKVKVAENYVNSVSVNDAVDCLALGRRVERVTPEKSPPYPFLCPRMHGEEIVAPHGSAGTADPPRLEQDSSSVPPGLGRFHAPDGVSSSTSPRVACVQKTVQVRDVGVQTDLLGALRMAERAKEAATGREDTRATDDTASVRGCHSETACISAFMPKFLFIVPGKGPVFPQTGTAPPVTPRGQGGGRGALHGGEAVSEDSECGAATFEEGFMSAEEEHTWLDKGVVTSSSPRNNSESRSVRGAAPRT